MNFVCDAILFDLDGTLIDSLAAVDRAWTSWAQRVGFDPAIVLTKIHGRRSLDSLRAIAPHLEAEEENKWLRNAESRDTEGVHALPGVQEFISSLDRNRWCIVTSGTVDVATPRLIAAGIPIPNVAVYGDDVERGKPAPDPFLEAAKRLGVMPNRCLVFEDTVAGLRSGRAAGCSTIGVRILPGESLYGECDAVIESYRQLHAKTLEDRIFVGVDDPKSRVKN